MRSMRTNFHFIRRRQDPFDLRTSVRETRIVSSMYFGCSRLAHFQLRKCDGCCPFCFQTLRHSTGTFLSNLRVRSVLKFTMLESVAQSSFISHHQNLHYVVGRSVLFLVRRRDKRKDFFLILVSAALFHFQLFTFFCIIEE